MEFSVSIKGLDRALLLFDEKKIRKAARMAVNDGLTTGRKTASQSIRKDWNIKAGRINKELRAIKRARNDDLTAIIQTKGAPISLIHFGAKWRRGRMTTTGTKSTVAKRASRKGGVTVQIKRGQQTRLPNAFIATGRNSNTRVFQRFGKSRLPIKSMSTITLASMFDQELVMRPTLTAIDKRMNQRFDYHRNRLLGW